MQKTTKLITDEKGQALVFVVATMTVALAIGVGVSLRNLSSISRTSRTDTAVRAQAAAEGGAENVLSRSEEDITSMVGQVAEEIVFTPSANSGDNITAVASVTVENYNIPSGSAYLPLEISRDQVSEVKLSDSSSGLQICWSSQDVTAGSDLYYTAYNEDGDITRSGISQNGDREGYPEGYSSGGTFDSADSGNEVFDNCHSPTLPSSPLGLRIRSINADSRVGIYTTGSLPDQGYLITSIGKLQNVELGDDAEVVVTVVRSAPFMPGIFDFGIFSGSDGDALN